MASENSVTLVGNVTRDPELKFLSSGQATTQFGLAVNRRYQKQGEWVEDTSFFDVVIWRDMAENFAECIAKGTRVIVTGRLEQRSWESADGSKRSKVELVADEIGPSLRWATATVTKTQRSGGTNGGAQAPRSAAAPVPAADQGYDPFAGSNGGADEPF